MASPPPPAEKIPKKTQEKTQTQTKPPEKSQENPPEKTRTQEMTQNKTTPPPPLGSAGGAGGAGGGVETPPPPPKWKNFVRDFPKTNPYEFAFANLCLNVGIPYAIFNYREKQNEKKQKIRDGKNNVFMKFAVKNLEDATLERKEIKEILEASFSTNAQTGKRVNDQKSKGKDE